MKSRTSFCNAHVLRKDITRFAPLWAVYTVILALFVFNNSVAMLQRAGTSQVASALSNNMGEVSMLFVLYGFGCATLLFGDLFKTRMAGGLHTMPLRRETWFGTHVVAGILFAIVPNTLIALALTLILGEFAFVAWLWWLVVTGQFLFHFALAVLCVMLAGNLLGHAAAFGTIEFFSLLVYSVYDTVYEPMLYGIVSDDEWFAFFSPAQHWYYQDWLQWEFQDEIVMADSYSKYVSAVTEQKYIYEGLIAREWIYLAVCAVLAVIFFALALVLYRRRKLECAGDFITSPVMGWVLLILGSVCAAIVIPVAGFVIAFFGILMLWERTLKVFRKKNLIAFGITAAAVLLTLGLTFLDPLGITTKIPDESDIEFVTLNPQWGDRRELTDSDQIRAVLDAHEYALIDRDLEEGDWYTLQLQYTLKNGSTMRRSYDVKADVPAMAGIKNILSSWEVVFDGQDLQSVKNSAYRITMYQEQYDEDGYYMVTQEVILPEEVIPQLLDAINLDCREGTLAQNMCFHDEEVASLNFRFDAETLGVYEHKSLSVFDDSTHTLAVLEEYMQ